MPTRHQLYVLRHAKSSWDDPSLEDHDRPLAPRGQKAVALVARHLRDRHIQPDQVLCSSARRAVETCAGVSPVGELLIEPDLYGASSGGLLARLHQVPAPTGSVMLIGHNPAVQMLVLMLADPEASGGHLEVVNTKFPTGALATLSFDGAWSRLRPGDAKLESLVRPRDLG